MHHMYTCTCVRAFTVTQYDTQAPHANAQVEHCRGVVVRIGPPMIGRPVWGIDTHTNVLYMFCCNARKAHGY